MPSVSVVVPLSVWPISYIGSYKVSQKKQPQWRLYVFSGLVAEFIGQRKCTL